MGFLDNSGDIILDAVLTDTGRMRLSKGDGSFRIAKFALGDDEIDYGLYDKSNTNGSAYYDVTILQTPILEAFTNNTSLLKSKLISVNRNNVLFLPVIKLFTTAGRGSSLHSSGIFVVPVDKTTKDKLGTLSAGILNGYQPNDDVSHIAAHQGLDTDTQSSEDEMPRDLVETSYIVEMDNRLGELFVPPATSRVAPTGLSPNTTIPPASPAFIDDDQIATYYLSLRRLAGFVSNLGGTQTSSIQGPRGTKILFRVGSSLNTRTSDYLFRTLGTLSTAAFTNTAGNNLNANEWRYIDTTIRITGVNTGYRIDIPIRYIKSL